MNLLDNIDINRFINSLQYMWKGMLCIFIVIFVLILFVYLLNGINSKIEARKKAKEDAQNGSGS